MARHKLVHVLSLPKIRVEPMNLMPASYMEEYSNMAFNELHADENIISYTFQASFDVT